MSAYAEWKAEMITDAEYNTNCRKEEYISRYWEEHPDEFSEEEEFEEDEIDEF